MRFLTPLNTVLRDEAAEGGEGSSGTTAVVDSTAAMADLQAQIDALKAEKTAAETRAAEEQVNAKYWFEKAKTAAVKPEKEEKSATNADDEDDDVDLIEVISKKGSKGLREIVKKDGFATVEDVQAAIEARAQQMTEEAALVQDYPEIKDDKSDFFRSVKEIYQPMIARGTPPLVAMRAAADKVYLENLKSGKVKTPAEIQEREERAAAAGGDKSRTKTITSEDESLTPGQETIIAQMCPDDMKLDDFKKLYQARAKAGVNFRRN